MQVALTCMVVGVLVVKYLAYLLADVLAKSKKCCTQQNLQHFSITASCRLAQRLSSHHEYCTIRSTCSHTS
jgi:hypothetical protein